MERPRREENLNALTHGLGTVFAIVATALLLNRVSGSGNSALRVTCVLYGIAMIGVFFCSTMSHWVRSAVWRRRYRQLDQAFIYLLIVASYTPFFVVQLQTRFWWILLAVMWLIALVGFVSKIWVAHRVDSVSVLGYAALGWMPALGGPSLFQLVPAAAAWGMLGGGVLYSVGTWFLLNDKKIWYFHGIWHLFVIAGVAVHWWTNMVFVV